MANIIEIHDFSDPALDVYARLTENQLLNRADPDNALFVAESPLDCVVDGTGICLEHPLDK